MHSLYLPLKDKEYSVLAANKKYIAHKFSLDLEVVSRWVREKKSIPLYIFKDLFGHKKLLDLLDKRKIHAARGRKGVLCRTNINPEIAYLIGLVCTDGYLSRKHQKIQITQKNYAFLKLVAKLIERNFKIQRNTITLEKTGVSKLYVYSLPLEFIFSKLYNIPEGKKGEFQVPTIIKNNNIEIVAAFLAGVFDGDGSVSVNDKEYFERPKVGIFGASKEFMLDCLNLLKYLKIEAHLYFSKGVWRINVNKIEDISKIFFIIAPYILLERKRERFRQLLAQRRCLELIRVPYSHKIKSLLKKAWKKLGGRKYLLKFINLYLTKKIKLSTLSDWVCGRYPAPLIVIIKLCDLLEKDILDYIPNYQSVVLLAQKLIPNKCIKEVRKPFKG